MTGANMNFMQPVTASYTGHDFDAEFVPTSISEVTARGMIVKVKGNKLLLYLSLIHI